MRGEEWRAQWERALAAKATQQRRQRHGPQARGVRIRNGHTLSGAGMVRVPPDRQAVITKLVRAAITSSPSIAAAKKALQQWAGHPSDPRMRDDAIELLDRIEAEAKDVPASRGGAAQEGTT